MANLFAFLLIFSVIATIVFFIKPSLTALNHRPVFSRIKILVTGVMISLISLALLGVFAPKVPKADIKKLDAEKHVDGDVKVTEEDGKIIFSPVEQNKKEKIQAEIDEDAEVYKKKVLEQQQTLADEDKPHFDWPRVDYTKTVAKVSLDNDKAILKAVGKPVQDTENNGDANGEPMKSYWFSKQSGYGLEIDLSRTAISISWQFDAKEPATATAAFEDGQRITRALLGGKAGSELYENIAKGLKYDELTTDEGIVIKNARCGSFICRYEVLR